MLLLDPDLRDSVRQTVTRTYRAFGRTPADPTEYDRPRLNTSSGWEIASRLEYCRLSPNETAATIRHACAEAVQHGFHAVCVYPCWVAEASHALRNSHIRVTAVVAFPYGMSEPSVKAFEAKEAVRAGADEVDVVARISYLEEGNGLIRLHDELQEVAKSTDGRPIKAVIEMGLINGMERKIEAACVAELAGVALIKTATGFVPDPSKSFVMGPLGSTEMDIQIAAAATTSRTGIKAAGGIRNRERTVAMLNAGATRIGTSYAPLIVA